MSSTPARMIAYDCRHYLGDRPCSFHKQSGVVCRCDHFQPLGSSILIIKLDAIGDVLRTTCLLPVIQKAWPDARVTWLTRPASVPLLQNNPYVHEVVAYGPDALLHLGTRSYDRVINLDASKTSTALAQMAQAGERLGYVMDNLGVVRATSPAGEEWLRMGVFDDLKKQNRRTYQEIMCSILGLPTDGLGYVLQLTAKEKAAAREQFARLGVDPRKKLIGIHTGGGERWRLKQWHTDRFEALAGRLSRTVAADAQIILFGGPSEQEINQGISARLAGAVFDAGCDNSLRHFSALMGECALVLSGDTLAMHVALAVGCRVVTLFGPTSSAEIELFGRGEKVVPDLGCLVCYKQQCDFVPNCMDKISVETVHAAMIRQFQLLQHRTGAAATAVA